MKLIRVAILTLLLLAPLTPFARAQNPASAPTTKMNLPEGPLKILITGVEGLVQFRPAEDQPWKKAAVNTELAEGAELRTGPKSAVRFVIQPDQVVTLDRLGTVKLLRANFESGKIFTDLGMKFGRTRFEVEAAGVEHESTIHSPSSTLAVRGTQVTLEDQAPFPPRAVSITGRAQFRNARREMVAFGGKSKTHIDSDSDSAAQSALITNAINATTGLPNNSAALRQTDLLLTQGGFLAGNVLVGNSSISDSALASFVPGNLDFTLRWGSPNAQLADLNLVVIAADSTSKRPDFVANPPFIFSLNPKSDPLISVQNSEGQITRVRVSTAYPTHSFSGGDIARNHVGPAGLEIASWPKNFPGGVWAVGVFNLIDSTDPKAVPQGANQPVKFRIDVFQNHQPVGIPFTGTVNFGDVQIQPFVIEPNATPAAKAARGRGR